MTKSEIKNQIEELKEENEEMDVEQEKRDHPNYVEMMTENSRDIKLLSYAVENATDEDLTNCQLSLPGRVSVMRWAKKHM